MSRGTYAPIRDRDTPTKKVKGKSYILFPPENVNSPIHVCFMALCTYSGFGWKAMNNLRKQADKGDFQPDLHGLVNEVSNNSLNEMVVKSLNAFFKGLQEKAEPHSISVVRTRSGVVLRQDNDNIWLAPHHTRRSLYVSWLAQCGWIASPDNNGSYGKIDEFDPIVDSENCLPVCCWKTFDDFWRINYTNMKIRSPYTDTCCICWHFNNSLKAIYKNSIVKRGHLRLVSLLIMT